MVFWPTTTGYRTCCSAIIRIGFLWTSIHFAVVAFPWRWWRWSWDLMRIMIITRPHRWTHRSYINEVFINKIFCRFPSYAALSSDVNVIHDSRISGVWQLVGWIDGWRPANDHLKSCMTTTEQQGQQRHRGVFVDWLRVTVRMQFSCRWER